MSKVCSKCSLSLEESFFLKGRSVCKNCRSAISKDRYKTLQEEKETNISFKECIVCKVEKSSFEFRVGNNQCLDCYNKKRRDNRSLKNQPDPSPSQIKLPEGFKLCKICSSVKKIDEFREKRQKCKKCENVERVAYKKGEIQKKPQSDFGEDDPFSKQLKAACRNRIRETLPKEISQKLTDENRFCYVYDYIGCDMDLLKKWLRYNYNDKMNDDNYGKYWFMDHVIPIHTFDIKNKLEQNKKNCYSWFNLSCLGAIDNSRKFIGVDKTQLETHKNHLIQFCAENGIEPDQNYLILCAKHLDAGNPLESSTTTSL